MQERVVDATAPQSQQPIAASPVGAAPPQPSVSTSFIGTPRAGHEPQSFNHRLRCTQYRAFFGSLVASEVLSLLCARQPLDALKLLVPLAEAGDERAMTALALLGNVGASCEEQKRSPRFRVTMLEHAQRNGASSQILQRLDDVLAEEEAGRTAEELEGCRQAASEFKRLMPGMLEQFVSVLGRSVAALRGENELDVAIEHARKSLVSGNADSQWRLASELLRKDTLESQTEAMALLREAAPASRGARLELAQCLLRGCPTPVHDRTEARELLKSAALDGDSFALRILAGPAQPDHFDLDATLPVTERYAWGQLRQRLNEEGCFGAAEYVWWAASPTPPLNLLTLSATDAATAEARAADLLAKELPRTRRLLGCGD